MNVGAALGMGNVRGNFLPNSYLKHSGTDILSARLLYVPFLLGPPADE